MRNIIEQSVEWNAGLYIWLSERNIGIRWRFTERLDDLDFADHLALLSSTRRQLQLKNERLSNASKEQV